MRALDTARLLYVAVLCLSPTSHALRLPHSSRLASSSTALLSSDPPTLFALTTDGFLVAVDVDTGDLRWRRQSTGGVAHGHLQLCGEVLLSASNRTTEAVSTESGKLLWAHESDALQSTAPYSQRLVCEAGPSPAVLSIVGSNSQRLDPRSGKSLSTVLLPTHSVYLPLQNDPDIHRVVAFEEKAAALLDVSSADGSITKVASANLPSRRGSPSRGIVLSAPATSHAAYLWIHDSRLSSVRVSGNGLVEKSENFGSVRDFVRIGYENHGISLVSRSDGTSVILRLLDTGELEQIGQFKRSTGASRFAASLDQAGSLHIARLSWSTTLQLSTVDVVSVSLEEKASAPIVSGQTIPIDLSTANTEDSFSFALYALATGRLLPEFFVLFSSKSSPLQAWKGTTLSWTSAAVDAAAASLDQSRRTLVSSSNSIEMLIRGNSIQRSLWRHQFEDGTHLEHIAEQSSDTMLSPGRANADRSSSFKYRNPNVLAVVVSTSEANLSIRLLSLDNGVEVGRFLLPFTADPTAPVAIALVEDWIVCTFRTTSLSVPSNVLVSMYLSQQPDSETVISQARFFVSPRALHVEGFTKTRLGVASRDCLLTDGFGQLVVLPRRAINPNASPAPGSNNLAGGDVVLESLPSGRIVGRDADLAEVLRIVTRPGQRESEAFVASPEHDEFSVTLRPSGSFDSLTEAFSRTQVVAVLAILLSSLVLARSTARKRTITSNWIE